jgi:DedD protein
MATATQQDTEITLGTGRMLAIFFTLVLVCAFFFSIGFSLGRKTALAGTGTFLNAAKATPTTVVRPSAAKNDSAQATPQSTDFSFYKAVGQNSAEASGATSGSENEKAAAGQNPANSTGGSTAAGETPASSAEATAAPGNAGYFVQVAAVSRQEDAAALVEALKKKQYPAFSANNPAADKFFHVQVGPYGEIKDAEAMRARLIADGYNPIVKK